MGDGREARVFNRQEIGRSATLCFGDSITAVEVEDISMGGAKIKMSSGAPEIKTVVRLEMAPFGDVRGLVAWSRRNSVGIKFDDSNESIGELLYALASYGNAVAY